MAAQKLIIEVVGDSRGYERALKRSGKATTLFGKQVTGVSKSLSVGTLVKGAAVFAGLTVGIQGVSRALRESVTASTEFQASLQKMIGLSGVSAGAISGLRQDVLRLAPSVGKGPRELAEALFFITSSGIKAADAMEVLKVSAQAAAAGLGETQVVADAITSALNAYGQQNITAEQATDVLVATVREGKGEATEFAGVIGNVAAIAGELGVSFDQVGASLAAMTRLGTDAQTAAIQLQQLFSGLLSTSPKVNKAFERVGLSLDDIRAQIATPGGFLPALQKIKTAFAGNTVALREAFPEIRSFRGLLALVGKQAGPVSGIFDRLSKSTGSLKSAFGAITKTQAQQFARLNASIDVFKITLGSALAPAILDVVKPLNRWLSVTKNQETVQRKIRETVKTVVGIIKGLVDVMRPLVTFAVDVTKALGGMKEALKGVAIFLVVGKVVNYAAAILGLSGNSKKAARNVALLKRQLILLGAVGVIGIGIEILIHKEEVDKKVKDFLRGHGAGFLTGGQITIDPRIKLEKVIALRDKIADAVGESDLMVVALDKVIARLLDAAGAANVFNDAVSASEHGRGRLGGIPEVVTPPTTVTGDDELTPAEKRAIRRKAAKIAAAARAAAKKSFENALAGLDILATQAERTSSLQDDLAVQRSIEKVIRARLAVTKNDLDLQRQLVETQNEQLSIQKEIEANRQANVLKKQFQALGLTAEGEKPTPSSAALLKRATGLQEQIKGTVFDTGKTRSMLKKIVAFLKKTMRGAKQEVRAAILDMLNGISDAFDGDSKEGPLTKTHGIRSAQIIKGLGLTQEQAEEVQRRLAHGTTTAPGRTPTNAPGAGGGRNLPSGGIFLESHTTIRLDGKVIANVVTRNQQKDRRRNPPQKRGSGRGRP